MQTAAKIIALPATIRDAVATMIRNAITRYKMRNLPNPADIYAMQHGE